MGVCLPVCLLARVYMFVFSCAFSLGAERMFARVCVGVFELLFDCLCAVFVFVCSFARVCD